MKTIIIPRGDWGAQYGKGHKGAWLRTEVVVHTEAGALIPEDDPLTPVNEGFTFEQEAARMRSIERFHAVTRGWGRIGYSFVIFPSGRVYEGCGWGQTGAHTEGRNSTTYGLCFAGHGDKQAATQAAWLAARAVVREGLELGALSRDYVVSGHRDYARKSCPGALIYPAIGSLRGLKLGEEVTQEDIIRIAEEVERRFLMHLSFRDKAHWNPQRALLDRIVAKLGLKNVKTRMPGSEDVE